MLTRWVAKQSVVANYIKFLFWFDICTYLIFFSIFKDIYTIMVGCGIENVNLLVSALKRHTRHVQVIVFERDDMVSGPMVVVINSWSFCQMFHCLFFQNKNSSSNVLRETTTLFILAYFFPGKYIVGNTGSSLPTRFFR